MITGVVFAEAPPSVTARGAWCVRVDPRTGTPLPIRNSPISDGKSHLVAALQDLVVGLLQTDTGVGVTWEYRTGGTISGSPAVHPVDGSLRVHSSDGRLHCLSAGGKPLWSPVAVGRPLSWASPLVDHEGNTWICSHAGGLIKVETDGTTSRRPYFSSPTKFDCTGVIHDGTFVVGGEDHFVHCVELCGDRGTERWDISAGRGRTGWYVNSAIAMASGPTFIVASADQHLYGLAPDGSQSWKTKLSGQLLGSPVVDPLDRIYAGLGRSVLGSSPTGALACFDARSQQWLWEIATTGAVESTPVVGSDDTVYFGDNTGCIYAVGTNGQIKWKLWVGNRPVRSAGTIVSPGRVVFGDDSGRLFALGCESPGLGAGWPQALGSRRLPMALALAPAERTGNDKPISTVVEQSCTCFDKPPNVVEPKIDQRGPEKRGRLAKPVSISANAIESAAASAVPGGQLASVIDFRTGTNLLEVSPHLWRLPRPGYRPGHKPGDKPADYQERPLYLTNDGPGDLEITVRLTGAGARISPSELLRIRPGRGKFVVLHLEQKGDDWVLLDFVVRNALPGRRQRVRVYAAAGQ